MKKAGLVASIVVLCMVVAGYFYFVSAAPEKSTTKPAAKESSAAVKGSAPAAAKEEAPAAKPAGNAENAATVNGVAITKADYEAEVTRFDRQVAMTGRNPDDKETSAMKKKILDNLIGRELLKQQAAKEGIKADDAETTAQMEVLKKKFGSEQDYQDALKKMNITEQTIKEQFSSELVMRKLIDKEVADKITLGPNDAKDFYDKNPEIFKTPEMIRASHILVKVDEKATPEEKAKALEKIKDIQKKVQGGADFAELAKEVSDCPSKEKGGDLGFFQKGQMVPAFETAALALKQGQVSDVVETEFGYHLIKLTDKKDAGTMAFEEMKPRIEQHIKSEKVSEQLTQYMDGLRSKAKVEVFIQ